MERYYRNVSRVAARLLELCAEVLGDEAAPPPASPPPASLFDAHFAPLVDKHTSNLVAGYYMPRPAAAGGGGDDGELRVTAHSDTGLFTIIAYSDGDVTGLEVRLGGSAEWSRVSRRALPPGALVVNIGDSMRRLSGGRYPSTPHRVRSPEARDGARDGARGVADRLALIFFYAARYDARL